MKRVESLTGILILSVILLVIVGCSFAGLSMPEKNQTVADVKAQDLAAAQKEESLAVADAQREVIVPVVDETVEEINESMNVTQIVVEKDLPISGSADELQSDLELCPHISREFDCDRYDIRGCKFQQRIGQNGFYPQRMRCRSGEVGAGERHDSKYCFIQECSPVIVEGIAEKFGGLVAYAEYDYKLEKTGTGIMTYWNLRSCGEEFREFDSKFDCQIYYSEWRQLWG